MKTLIVEGLQDRENEKHDAEIWYGLRIWDFWAYALDPKTTDATKENIAHARHIAVTLLTETGVEHADTLTNEALFKACRDLDKFGY